MQHRRVGMVLNFTENLVSRHGPMLVDPIQERLIETLDGDPLDEQSLENDCRSEDSGDCDLSERGSRISRLAINMDSHCVSLN